MENQLLAIALAPLFGAIVAGLFGRQIGRAGAHWITILAVAVSTVLSLDVLRRFLFEDMEPFNQNVYTWLESGGISFSIGFLVDKLTAVMMSVVTFVSLMVHIYTIGYMKDDPGYQRFFAYISLFTFSMLMLVMANNFLQLFFGWEAVGLVSYLLIGFWYKKPTAIFANLKAFLVNRVGDFGFLLGIAAVLLYFGTLDYQQVFDTAPGLSGATIEIFEGKPWNLMTVVCILLFIGAMGKSAQAPLHVWLPDSMEGPTPISALIHAATMVTAGIFMVARMSPLFELTETALSFVLVIGAITAFFMGLIGIVQNDIKRVVAYSTLSQLGYMTAALGASAYSAAVFHLMTHAFFKALLFLGAGSVIIALHHQQDMRNMGGLRKYMPITWITGIIGTLALIGFPGFSGFYSKDAIISAVSTIDRAGAGFAQWMLVAGVFVTALYSFRLLYLTFHGETRMDEETRSHAHESPWVVTVPLVLLAIPSVGISWWAAEPMLFGDFWGQAIVMEHDSLAHLREIWTGPLGFALHGFVTLPVWLALAGAGLATYIYLFNPGIADRIQGALKPLHTLLDRKYWFDEIYQALFAGGSRLLGKGLWKGGDEALIDGLVVNGSARTVGWLSGVVRWLQTGRLYTYAFAMIIGLIAMLGAFVLWAR
ncbi:MAG: NADH-quinone oxidoreductase subunit L [Xanthomonadales bacterium]|nr:NADH-quinone oxidoreductase subunit L [Xanthomonadales bacterium]